FSVYAAPLWLFQRLTADLLAVSYDRLDSSARIFQDVVIDLCRAGLQQQYHGRTAEFEIPLLFASCEVPAAGMILNNAPDARGADVDVDDVAEVSGLERTIFAPVLGEDRLHPSQRQRMDAAIETVDRLDRRLLAVIDITEAMVIYRRQAENQT